MTKPKMPSVAPRYKSGRKKPLNKQELIRTLTLELSRLKTKINTLENEISRLTMENNHLRSATTGKRGIY